MRLLMMPANGAIIFGVAKQRFRSLQMALANVAFALGVIPVCG